MLKTITARNLRFRVPLAVEVHPGQQPEFGTAYRMKDGVIKIALANKHHYEVKASDKITVTYTPVEDGARLVRWCRACEEPHLRRIKASKSALAWCDASEKRYIELRKQGKGQAVINAETKVEERIERIERVMERPAPSVDRLWVRLLQGIAKGQGTECRQFRETVRHSGLTYEAALRAVTLG